jgi:hypothetical protein
LAASGAAVPGVGGGGAVARVVAVKVEPGAVLAGLAAVGAVREVAAQAARRMAILTTIRHGRLFRHFLRRRPPINR